MKQSLFIIILSVFALLLTSCREEVDAPLQLDVTENTAPDVTKVGYDTSVLGPGRHEKEYQITTDFSASELKMQCNNCKQLQIETALRKPYVPETGGSTTIEATAEETGIYVSVAEGNIITIRFAQLDPENSSYGYYGTVKVHGKIKGETKTTTINIGRRNPRLDEPK